MGKVIEVNFNKSKEEKIINWGLFEYQQEIYDSFFDYVGEELYYRIKCGEKLTDEDKRYWSIETEEEFLNTWRGNSEEEFQKYLKENNLEDKYYGLE